MAIPAPLTSGTLADPAPVMVDFNYLDAKSDNITEVQTPNAKFPNNNLLNPNVEEVLKFTYAFGVTTAGNSLGAGSGAGFTTGIKDFLRLFSSTTYTILAASFILDVRVIGVTGNTQVKIEAGSWAGTVWTPTTTIVNTTTIANVVGVTQGDFALNATTVTSPTQLALNVVTAMTTPMQGNLTVTLTVKRALQN